MRFHFTIITILLAMLLVGCGEGFRINVAPDFRFQPTDRLACIDASGQGTSSDGQRVVDYLTNEFVAMDIQVVERSMIEKVLEETTGSSNTSETEKTALVASATRANLIGIHRIQSRSETPVDKERPEGTKKYVLAGVFRIVQADTNRVVISATAEFSAQGKAPDAILQDYAKQMYAAIERALRQPNRGPSSASASSPPTPAPQ